jgi:C4-dicarboxylate transporter DctM subunit
MSEWLLVLLFMVVLFGLLGSGVWVGLSLMGVAWISMELFTTRPAGDAMAVTVWGTLSSWTLTALPLFIWMGEVLFRSRLSEDLFKGLAPWMGRLPGRLLHTNVVGCAIFAAISGSSAATCATIGKMSIPELRGRKYPETMVVGSLAGSGTLGLLIPPSIILIVYGVSTDVSIAQLFIAGILPGIMLALLFMGYLGFWSLLYSSEVPPNDIRMTFIQKIRASRGLIPPMLLILFVLGSIYGGYATATESAALGVVGALLLSWWQGSMNRETFITSLLGATRTSAMIMLILAGSSFLSLAMGFTGLPRNLAQWIGTLHLKPYELIMALTVFFMIMGCFLDGISMVVLTMAVLLPMVQEAKLDLIWFGIFVVIVVEMAQITPPVGFNLFVLQGLTGHSILFVARAAVPYFILMTVAVAVIVLFPDIATFLPSRMHPPAR